MKPLTIHQIRIAVAGKALTALPKDAPAITAVCTDSQRMEPFSLFIAIKGERHDGHAHLPNAASKGAVESMTYGLSKELAGDGIRVNCVSPGASETRIHADAGTPDKLARVAPMIPMGRVGQPEESAEAVLFLLSDAASYISGTVLRVAGGR